MKAFLAQRDRFLKNKYKGVAASNLQFVKKRTALMRTAGCDSAAASCGVKRVIKHRCLITSLWIFFSRLIKVKQQPI